MSNSESPPVVAAAKKNSADELLQCLQIVAHSHGELPTRDALMAGLPAENGRLTPGLFARAARRGAPTSAVSW